MAAETQTAPVRTHRWLIRSLLVVATIIAFFACFAVWANRQALNTDRWTETSSKLLANPAVQNALSVYLVNQLYTSDERAGTARTGAARGDQGRLRTPGGRAARACERGRAETARDRAGPGTVAPGEQKRAQTAAHDPQRRRKTRLDEERRGRAEPARTRHPARGPARAVESGRSGPGKSGHGRRRSGARDRRTETRNHPAAHDRPHHDPAREPAQDRAGHHQSRQRSCDPAAAAGDRAVCACDLARRGAAPAHAAHRRMVLLRRRLGAAARTTDRGRRSRRQSRQSAGQQAGG